jgi:recombinational DNA repair protein RecR
MPSELPQWPALCDHVCACVLQVREHIQRTQCTEISWRDLCTICTSISHDSIREMINEYAGFDIWTIEDDANGQPRLLVDQVG